VSETETFLAWLWYADSTIMGLQGKTEGSSTARSLSPFIQQTGRQWVPRRVNQDNSPGWVYVVLQSEDRVLLLAWYSRWHARTGKRFIYLKWIIALYFFLPTMPWMLQVIFMNNARLGTARWPALAKQKVQCASRGELKYNEYVTRPIGEVSVCTLSFFSTGLQDILVRIHQ